MTVTSRQILLATLAIATLLGACASKPQVKPSVVEPDSASFAGTAPVSTDVATVTPQRETPPPDLSDEERAARAALEREGMIVYFDYDSSQIRSEFLPLLAAHARYANRFRTASIRLEGHSDERGSREYNIALGERRARAVLGALQLQGVPAAQLDTVSYGEERPAVSGSSEASWSRNRRVEITYPR